MLKPEKIKKKERKKRVIKNKTDKNDLISKIVSEIENNINNHKDFLLNVLRDYLEDQSIKYLKDFING